ncbi:MAG TPA: hypothetical protein VK158_03065 [Acidobacteriota bacterium]|nr:hypothetical protein [Acidobacteriota bacterium]
MKTKQYADGKERFQFFDFDSPSGPHYTAILPECVIDVRETEKRFEPTFIDWKPPYNWNIKRDWGKFS